MNAKQPPTNAGLDDQMKRLQLRKNVDAEVAPTHAVLPKIAPRPSKIGVRNPSVSKSIGDLGYRYFNASASSSGPSSAVVDSATITREPSTSSIGIKLKPTRSSTSKNYTFNANEMRDIERNNQTLMKKIMHTKVTDNIRRTASSTSALVAAKGLTASAAINRKKQQRHIDIGNDILQRKLMRISGRKPSLVPK